MIPNEEGTIISSIEPTSNRRKIWIQKRGKNLINFGDSTFTSIGVTTILNKNYLTLKGTTSESGNVLYFYLGKFNPGTYIFSSSIVSGSSSGSGLFASYIRDLSKNEIASTSGTKKFTLINKMDLYFQMFVNSSDMVFNDLKIAFQLQQGSVDTPIEEWVDDKIYVKNEDGIYEEYINSDSINKNHELIYKEYETTPQRIETSSYIDNMRGEITTKGGDILVDISFFALVANGTAFLDLIVDNRLTLRMGALSQVNTNYQLFNFKYIIRNLSRGVHTIQPQITLNSGIVVTMGTYQSKTMLLQEL